MDDYDFDYSDDFDSLGPSAGFDYGMNDFDSLGSNLSNAYNTDFGNFGNNYYDDFDSLGGLWDGSSFSQDALSNITGGGYPTNNDLSGYLRDIQDENLRGWGAGTTGSEGSITSALQKLFTNPNLLGKGISALYEGDQNKKNAKTLNNAANSTTIDPFGSQRAQYQQELQNTVQNPYSSAIVKSQVDNLQRQQAIKDAAAGRRSNTLSTAPSMLAAQAQIAQNYINQLGTLAGANIAPNSSAYANLINQASKSDTNGYISPLLSLLGNTQQSGSNAKTTNSAGNSNYTNSLLSFLFG